MSNFSEVEFWQHLERLVSTYFSKSPDNTVRFLWCDGFVPEQYQLSDVPPQIFGKAWIANGPKQEQWQFCLCLPELAQSQMDIDWSEMLELARASLHERLTINREGRTIKMELFAVRRRGL